MGVHCGGALKSRLHWSLFTHSAGWAQNPKGPQNQPFCHQMGRRGTIWDLVTASRRRKTARFSLGGFHPLNLSFFLTHFGPNNGGMPIFVNFSKLRRTTTGAHGRPWAPHRRHMGRQWGAHGTPMGTHERPWAPHGRPWAPMGAPWAPMGTPWAPHGATVRPYRHRHASMG